MSRWRPGRSGVAVIAALVFAVGVASWQAALHWVARNPTPAAEVGVGETVRVEGTAVTLDAFDVATRLPSIDPEEEWVVAPDGTVLVQVVVTTEILDAAVDPDSHYCFATAVDADGREWETDSTIGYDVAGPGSTTCASSEDDPVDIGRPHTAAMVFLIPTAAADELVVDLELSSYDAIVRLTR